MRENRFVYPIRQFLQRRLSVKVQRYERLDCQFLRNRSRKQHFEQAVRWPEVLL